MTSRPGPCRLGCPAARNPPAVGCDDTGPRLDRWGRCGRPAATSWPAPADRAAGGCGPGPDRNVAVQSAAQLKPAASWPASDQCSTGLPSGSGLPPVATDSALKKRYTPTAANSSTV